MEEIRKGEEIRRKVYMFVVALHPLKVGAICFSMIIAKMMLALPAIEHRWTSHDGRIWLNKWMGSGQTKANQSRNWYHSGFWPVANFHSNHYDNDDDDDEVTLYCNETDDTTTMHRFISKGWTFLPEDLQVERARGIKHKIFSIFIVISTPLSFHSSWSYHHLHHHYKSRCVKELWQKRQKL